MSIPTQGQDGAAPAAAPSWRDKLAAKQRRRLEIPILISADDDGLLARSESQGAVLRLLEGLPSADPVALAKAREELAATEEALEEHIARVPVVSLPPGEYDALLSAHPATDPAHDGGVDWLAALPALAAACSAAAEDRPSSDEDVTWWAEVLQRPEWTKSDLLNLWGALLRLHSRAPSARVPFS